MIIPTSTQTTPVKTTVLYAIFDSELFVGNNHSINSFSYISTFFSLLQPAHAPAARNLCHAPFVEE